MDAATQMLAQMMRSHAYRELAAARLFGHGLQYAPEGRWMKLILWHLEEEARHYVWVAEAYQALTGDSLHAWADEKVSSGAIPFVSSWLELAMAQFLYDRAGYWQLQEYQHCPYAPYREVARRILGEERGHQDMGEELVVRLSADTSPGHQTTLQTLFEKWLKISLLSFGRPDSEASRQAIALGLKTREVAAVVQDYVSDIKPAMRVLGLHFPAPQLLGLQLPEDADFAL